MIWPRLRFEEVALSQLSHTMNMPETQSPTTKRSTNQNSGSTHNGNSSVTVETVEASPAKVPTSAWEISPESKSCLAFCLLIFSSALAKAT